MACRAADICGPVLRAGLAGRDRRRCDPRMARLAGWSPVVRLRLWYRARPHHFIDRFGHNGLPWASLADADRAYVDHMDSARGRRRSVVWADHRLVDRPAASAA